MAKGMKAKGFMVKGVSPETKSERKVAAKKGKNHSKKSGKK